MLKTFQNASILLSLNLTSHKRLIKPIHIFSYSNLSIIIDLEKLNEANSKSMFFSVNKFNLFSWHSRDHGNKKGNVLEWVRSLLKKHGGKLEGKVLLHCFPRILGKVFNPLSVFFCYDKMGKLCTIIYEVRNTYGGYHSYVCILKNNGKQKAKKKFFVSPFLPIKGEYFLNAKMNFKIVNITVDMYLDKKNKLLEAIQVGKIIPLSSKTLLLSILNGYAFPLKPFLSILYESARISFKGAKYQLYEFSKKHKTSST